MDIYALQVSGPNHIDDSERIAKVIYDAAKVLSADAEVRSMPMGTSLKVLLPKDTSGLPKILEGLGFTLLSKEEGDQVIKKLHKPSKVALSKENDFSGVIPRKYARKIVENIAKEEHAKPSAVEDTGGIPSGCYRHDGSQDRYYARTLQLKLAAKEFGPGVRFERDSDHTWWVVVELTNGQYGLKPATD